MPIFLKGSTVDGNYPADNDIILISGKTFLVEGEIAEINGTGR